MIFLASYRLCISSEIYILELNGSQAMSFTDKARLEKLWPKVPAGLVPPSFYTLRLTLGGRYLNQQMKEL